MKFGDDSLVEILLLITFSHCHLSCISHQWRIQNLSDTGILVWAPKLGAQVKVELMENYISYLISSTQMGLHVLRHLT